MNPIRLFAVALVVLCFAGTVLGGTTPRERAALQGLPGDVRAVLFSPDGKTLAVSTGILITIWEWSTNREIAALPGGMGVAFSRDGTVLAYPGQDEYNNDGLMIWDLSTHKKRGFIADDNVQSPVFSPDGKSVAAAVGSRVKVWDLSSLKESAPLANGHKCSINVIAYLAGGKKLVSGDARGVISLWDLADPANPKKSAEYKRATDESPINSIACNRDGGLIAASTGGGDIIILEPAALKEAGIIKGHKQGLPVKSVSMSPDNRYLASACSGVEDLETKIWEPATRNLIVGFVGHQGPVNCVGFSPDGKWLATGSDDKTAKLWDVASLVAMNAPKPQPKKESEK
jgi:WD40 repeat protein